MFTSVSIDASPLSDPDKAGVRAFAIVSGSDWSAASGAKLLPQYTEYDAGQDNDLFCICKWCCR